MKPRLADATLLFACLLWGISFVVVKLALESASPLAFAAIRFALATLVLAPFVRLRQRFSRAELTDGALLSLLLGIGFLAQTTGLQWTTPSRSAFLIALSSVLAPAIAAVALRERPRVALVVALALAGTGVFFLSAPESGGLNRGDALTLITAVLYGGHIVATGVVARRHDPLRLVWLEIAGTTVLAALGAVLIEDVRLNWSPRFTAALVYTAIGATVVTLLLQMKAQRYMTAARASVLFCSESLFAAITSWLVLGERLSSVQWLGGGLILVGMIVVELKNAPSAVSYQPSAIPVELTPPPNDISAPS
ncbi:MAG TPA: DMT family transporter [Gemmatimonadales bacterium]|nr:DMT family transporter [Gemmatimonadales bacterium]